MMCDDCLNCKYCEVVDLGDTTGEELFTCMICGEGGLNCPDYEEVIYLKSNSALELEAPQ